MEFKYIILIVAVAFLLLIMFGLAIVNYSFAEMVDNFNKYSSIKVNKTPDEFARNINEIYFGNSIKIKYDEKMFSDCFNTSGILTICSKYAFDDNIVGLAICAHELGHAFQVKHQQKRMVAHAKKLKISKFFSYLISPLIIAGLITFLVFYKPLNEIDFTVFSEFYIGIGLVGLGLISLIIALVAKFSTLGLEKDASLKALELLDEFTYLTDEQLSIAKKFLNSAKQTYVAEILRIMLKWTLLVKK